MRDMMRAFNAEPKTRRAFGRDTVVPDELYRTHEKRECPAGELWRFCPVKSELTVRGGNVETTVTHYRDRFCFRVNGNSELYLEHGYRVLIAFHPGHPERGCYIFNAETGARNREGWKFGEFLMLAPFVEPLPQFGLSSQHPDLKAKKKANAAVAQEFRAIVASEARVSVARDSRGRSARVEIGTGGALVDRTTRSIKEQRAELRKEQADDYERKAKFHAEEMERIRRELPAKRLAAKRRQGILDDEVMAALKAEREGKEFTPWPLGWKSNPNRADV